MKNNDGKNIRVPEHRGNDHDVVINYYREIKIVQSSNKKKSLSQKP
jgi:phage anti-repressor protein